MRVRILVGLLIMPGVSLAGPQSPQDYNDLEVVVTGSRLAARSTQARSSVSVIGRREIESRGATTVAELLRSIPGVTVQSAGGTGQLTQVYLRGLQSGQALVLLDGVPLNDPLNTERFFDFSTLSSAEIERIEIARGAQSVIHGSGAVGGVIQIFTRRAQVQSPLSARAGASTGSFRTQTATASLEGSSANVRYRLGVEHLSSQGFSAADAAAGNAELDGRQITTVSSLISSPWAGGELSVSGRFQVSRTELDAFTTTAVDDPDYVGLERSLRISAQNSTALTDRLSLRVSQGVSLQRRNNDFPPPSMGLTRGQFYFGDRFNTDVTMAADLSDAWALSIFGGFEREQGDFSEGVTVQSGLVQQTFSGGAELKHEREFSSHDVGARIDDHSRAGLALTGRTQHRLSLSVLGLEAWSLRAGVGTGFKSPTLYQLFYEGGGNPNLSPEHSVSGDLGVEVAPRSASWSLGVTGFESRIRNQIDWPGGASGYQNIGATLTRGLEWEARATPSREMVLRVSATQLLEARNDLTGARLPQRPRLALAASASWQFAGRSSIDGSLRFHGSRGNAYPAVTLPSYAVVDIAFRTSLRPNLGVLARLENAFDRRYQEVAGYGTAGRSAFVGIEAGL